MTINSLTLISLLLVSYLSAKLLTDKEWGKNKNEN